MKFSYYLKNRGHLLVQRNALVGLTAILCVLLILQTLLLFCRSERVILHPPEMTQSYWVEGNRFSPSYLEEMGLYFTHLLLDVSETSLLYQGDVLLRYVDSTVHGAFKTKLFEDQQRLKKENLSLHFIPAECQVFPDSLSVEITGTVVSYVSMKKIAENRETYRITFTTATGLAGGLTRGLTAGLITGFPKGLIKGRLFLKSFEVIKTDRPDSKE